MSMPIEREAIEATVEIVKLNSWFADDVACEGDSHPAGLYGHAESPAEYRVTFGKCGHTYLMCAGWVLARQMYRGTQCGCGAVSMSYDVTVVPFG